MYKLTYKYKYEEMKFKYLQLKKMIGGYPKTYADIVKGKKLDAQLIGKGSYGCVYSPPLKCDHPSCVDEKCLTGISKLMNYSLAEKELNTYKNLNVDKIDNTMAFHIAMPHLCVPQIKDIPESCDFIEKPLGLLIYDNGGDNAYNVFSKIITQKQPLKSLNMNIFVKSLKNILLGLKLFNENRIAHFDLKLDNIVTNIDKDFIKIQSSKFRLVDFGLSINYNVELNINNIFNGVNGMEYDLFQWHFKNKGNVYNYYPIDFYLVSFLKDKTLTEENKQEFKEYIEKYLEKFFIDYKQYGSLLELYSKPEFTNTEIYFTLSNLIKYRPFDKIILRIIQTVESFQFGIIIIEIMHFFPEYKPVFNKFLEDTKILHYNPFERTPINQLYDIFNINPS